MIQKPHAVDQQTLREALRDHFDGLLTEPMTLKTLSRYFTFSKNIIRQIIENTEGVEKVGGRYRLPLKKMPPLYHRDRGMMPRD